MSRELLAGQWAIEPQALDALLGLVEREKIDALAARPGTGGIAPGVVMRGDTAIVPVAGVILRHDSFLARLFGATTLDELAISVTAALESDRVARIVLDVDSPGGQVTGVAEMAEMVFDARGRKPITAYVGGLAASAAYWIASAADRIVADPTSRLGSIGAVATLFPGPAGVVEVVSRQSPRKRLDPSSDEARADAQRLVDDLADVFIDRVARNRDVSAERVLNDFGRGGMMIGRRAVEVGLVDELGSLEGVLAGGGNRSRESTSLGPGITPAEASILRIPEQPVTGDIPAGEDGDLEAQARRLWSTHERLRAEYGDFELYLATCRREGVHGPAADFEAPPAGATSTPSDAEIEATWQGSASLRAEYGGDFAAYAAHCRHQGLQRP